VKTIIVTGSSGFLGARVVQHALDAGFLVIGIDVNPPLVFPSKNFDFWQIDVNDMPLRIEQKIDFIVHTASSLPYGNNSRQFEANNINAAKLISCFTKENNTFLVEIGSSSVYGKPSQLPVTQKTIVKPLDNYARSKAAAEDIIHDVLHESDFCIVRPRTILGAGRSGIFKIFFSLISGNIPIPLPNSGRQVIQFVHVEDLAALSIYLGEHRISGIWPAASPEPRPLKDYLFTISQEYRVSIRYLPIYPAIFRLVGAVAFRLKLTKFTPWHFGAFPYDNYVDERWIPAGFTYKYSSTDSFKETFLSNNKSRIRVPQSIKIGRKI
jgi:nucleoside-diphosphate-sugar epimerase